MPSAVEETLHRDVVLVVGIAILGSRPIGLDGSHQITKALRGSQKGYDPFGIQAIAPIVLLGLPDRLPVPTDELPNFPRIHGPSLPRCPGTSERSAGADREAGSRALRKRRGVRTPPPSCSLDGSGA
jgi:hypothetical protein